MVALERDLPQPAPPPSISADAIPLSARRVGGSPRQVLEVVAIGTLVLGLFASRDLPSWTERLAQTRFGASLDAAATTWDEAMSRLGLTAPHEALRRGVRRLIEQPWDSGKAAGSD
ncbi:MAG: hypothetical protein JO305_07835 [Alphaproteobacteria bacterium]|nr:hypothetical protein [Alphaproteobacteria bacterium]